MIGAIASTDTVFRFVMASDAAFALLAVLLSPVVMLERMKQIAYQQWNAIQWSVLKEETLFWEFAGATFNGLTAVSMQFSDAHFVSVLKLAMSIETWVALLFATAAAQWLAASFGTRSYRLAAAIAALTVQMPLWTITLLFVGFEPPATGLSVFVIGNWLHVLRLSSHLKNDQC